MALLDVCTVDLSAVFLDVGKDRLYTLAPDDPARRSAQTVLWQALHDLCSRPRRRSCTRPRKSGSTIPGCSPSARACTSRSGTCPRRAPRRAARSGCSCARCATRVNAAIEPLRAAGTLATTAEAEVAHHRAARRGSARLTPYAAELASLLLVAGAEVVAGAGGRRAAGRGAAHLARASASAAGPTAPTSARTPPAAASARAAPPHSPGAERGTGAPAPTRTQRPGVPFVEGQFRLPRIAALQPLDQLAERRRLALQRHGVGVDLDARPCTPRARTIQSS